MLEEHLINFRRLDSIQSRVAYVCDDCGSEVIDLELHNRWHNDLINELNRKEEDEKST